MSRIKSNKNKCNWNERAALNQVIQIKVSYANLTKNKFTISQPGLDIWPTKSKSITKSSAKYLQTYVQI